MKHETIKVILVDDEALERNLLRNCIDWEKIGVEIVGEATNADEALGLVDQYRPEIVFTDINMPVTDGMKLSTMILEHLPDTKIVVVTCLDDFSYAHQSIKMGISDFIVKPINDEDVYKTVLKLKEQIEKKRSDSREFSELRQQFLKSLPYIREKFYNELILGGDDEKSIRDKMAFLGVTFKSAGFQIAVIECSDFRGAVTEDSTCFLSVMQVLNLAKNFYKGMVVFFDTMSRIVVINNDENVDLFESCELFERWVGGNSDCSVCIGLGTIKESICDVHASYQEALDALKYKIAVGSNSVILYSNIRIPDKKGTDLNELNSKLAFCIKSCLLEKACELSDACFDGIDLTADNADKAIRIQATNIVSSCFKQLTDSGVGTDYIYKFIVGANGDIIMLETLPDAKRYVKGVIQKAVGMISSSNKNKISDLIGDVREFVDENYPDSSLSLTSAAKKFFLNPSYLSRTFKKEMNMNFVEYLTSVRMERAKVLLTQSEKKAFEIAEIVGIPDANYFCSCFKKYTGESISSFKKQGSQIV
jgi:Response regulator containing CheY-like receiver domain and AraC-type DNA-binding domain